jgi:type I restriction enzyme S subunit
MSFNEWKITTLDNIAEIIMGQSPTGETCNNEGNGVPLLNGPTEFGIFYPVAVQYTTDPKKFSKEGDILFCVRGSTTGKMNWSNKEFAIGRGLAAIRHKEGIEYQQYLKAILDLHLGTLLLQATGSTFPNVSSQQLKNLPINVPNTATQLRISSILSSINEKIENNLNANQTLEEIARTIFKQWFVNFNYPNADGSRKHSEFGEIPSNWQISGIGEVCYVQNGYAFKSNDFKEEGEVSIIKIKNISGNVVDIEKTDFVDANVVERLDKKFKIESGSLLIAMTGAEVGKIGLVPLNEKNLWLNQRVGMFKEKIAYGNSFMYLLLSSDTYQANIQNSALGSAQPNISASAIESIRAIIPPAELIEDFGRIVNPMFEKILDNLAENETLKITRDSLLPKLMSGEIDVNISNV